MNDIKRRYVYVGLETSIEGGSISLIEDQIEIDSIVGSENVSRSEDILFNLDVLLKRNKIVRNEIEKVCVSNGPGSTTGIRIGLAIAAGIADSLKKVVFEISVLDAIRIKYLSISDLIVAIYDGETGVYFKEFIGHEDIRQKCKTDFIYLSLEGFIGRITELLKGREVSMALTENFLLDNGSYLAGKKYFRNLNVIKINGSLAKFVAMAGYFTNASDNE